ncbi:MAG: hypothetical protein JWR69_4158 [Pedosphaera sp.]|nr:hypothetical protein [Pedosphaera sp.]
MTAWAACIKSADRDALAAIRVFPGTECAEIGGIVWLRGEDLSEDLERALAQIPGLERFELLAPDRLKSPRSRIPCGTLPPRSWRALKDTIVPSLPLATLPGEARQKLALTLVRSRAEQTPSALITTLAAWADFASQAPMVRLEPLSFAVNEDRQTLVLGQPLPPLTGVRLVNQAGILTPCGYAWSPAVSASMLRELFGLGADDVAVLAADGTHQLVRAEQFVRASRSAARLTLTALNHD